MSCSGAHPIILKGQNPVSSLSSHPTAKPHCKTTLQNPPALQRNSTAHSAVVILTTQLLSRPIWQYHLTQQHYRNVTFAASSKASLTPCNTRKYQRFAVLPMPLYFRSKLTQWCFVYLYYIQKAVKVNVDFYSFCRYHVAYLRLILSESESCVTGAEMTKKNSNRATLRYYSLLLIG